MEGWRICFRQCGSRRANLGQLRVTEPYHSLTGFLEQDHLWRGTSRNLRKLFGQLLLAFLPSDGLLIHINHLFLFRQCAVLDLQAGMILSMLSLTHMLPVGPKAIFVSRLVRAKLLRQRAILHTGRYLGEVLLMLGPLLLILLLRFLLSRVQLPDSLLSVFIQTLQHCQGGNKIGGAFWFEIHLQPRQWIEVARMLFG